MQSRFTKISPYRCGQPRFARVGNEPANGPVVKYHLSPEEIARRYGPPVQNEGGQHTRRRRRLTKEYLTELLTTLTVGQIAERHRVPQKLVFELVDKYGLELDDKNRLINEEAKDMASIMETARNVLPIDKLGALLAAGKKGSEIAKEYNLPPWAVSGIKNEYWPGGQGFKPDDYLDKSNENQNIGNELPENSNSLGENVTETTQIVNEPVTEKERLDITEPAMDPSKSTPDTDESILPPLDLDTFSWVVPYRFGSQKMILKIKNDRVVLTAVATKALSPTKFIKIGVDATGTLVIVPTANGNEGYKLPENKYYSNFGGGNLIRFLEKHGYRPGDYDLELVNGYLVTTRR